MNTWNTSDIIELLKRSGEVALRHYQTPKTELKGDESLVTRADREIETLLAEKFDRPDDGVFMIGEETVSTHDESYVEDAQSATTAWVVDPIDGTAAYANQIPTWGVSIGMLESGSLRRGAVFNPVLGEVFLTDDQGGILFSENLPNALNWGLDDLRAFDGAPPPSTRTGLVSLSQSLAKNGGFNGHNPVQTVCSAVYSLAHLALGHYLAYAATLKLWDLAGMWPMLESIGFKGRLLSGEPFTNELSDALYHVAPNSEHRWAVRGHVIFAPNDEAIDYVLSHLDVSATAQA